MYSTTSTIFSIWPSPVREGPDDGPDATVLDLKVVNFSMNERPPGGHY